MVCFVLGGPGSGKGTVCKRLHDELGAVHLSAGELLRREMDPTINPDSPYKECVAEAMREGRIVPGHITVALLHQAMAAASDKCWNSGPTPLFLIDGFPRSMENLRRWREQADGPLMSSSALFLSCADAELSRRILRRAKTSGRTDDNAETIRKRFQTHNEDTPPLLQELARFMPVTHVRADQTADQVFSDVKAHLLSLSSC